MKLTRAVVSIAMKIRLKDKVKRLERDTSKL